MTASCEDDFLILGSREDRITICGVKLRPRIGVTPGERRFPQDCEADVTVWGNFEAAASTDALGSALDYSKLLATIMEAAHCQEYNLLETLAYRITRAVLQSYPASKANVRLRKRPASLTSKIDYIEVEVEEKTGDRLAFPQFPSGNP